MTTLLYDIARCPGVPNPPDEQPHGWREGCETCLRRTAPGSPHRQAWMEPPAIIGFFCEYLIEPGGHETLPPENVTRPERVFFIEQHHDRPPRAHLQLA